MCEQGIDTTVTFEVGAIILDEAQEIVTNRPQHFVAIPVVVVLVVSRVQVDRGKVDFATAHDLWISRSIIGQLAIPAEPHATMLFERSQNANRQTAGGACTTLR